MFSSNRENGIVGETLLVSSILYKYNITQYSRILVNGDAINGEVELKHNDRLVFGSTQLWVFQNPKEKGIESKKYPPITYEYAQEEIAAKAGIKVDTAGKQKESAIKDKRLTEKRVWTV